MRLAPLFVAVLLAGCALEPTPKTALATLPTTADLAQIASEAKICDRPAVAVSEVSSGFRYGCFCGAGYPDLRHPSGRANLALNEAERRELATEYLKIKPIDDIDRTCQAHDICWVLNGDGTLECNEELEHSLDDFRSVVQKGHRFDTESLQFRCAALALDIQFASLSVMQSRSTDAIKESSLGVTRFLTSPIIAGFALITQMQGAFKSYPEAGERCSVRELAPKANSTGA
jgi:hypothetical protein